MICDETKSLLLKAGSNKIMKMKHRRISFWFYSMVVICTAALVFLVKPLTLGIQQRWDIVVYQESRNTESETGHSESSLYDQKPDTSNYVKYTNWTQMKFGPYYVLGVAAGNSSNSTRWDILKLYASIHWNASRKGVSCCVKFNQPKKQNDDYYRQLVLTETNPNAATEMTSFHYTCSNPRPGIIPDGVALTIDNYTCGEEHVVYRKPYLPLRETETTLALCSKMAYGNRSAEMILEWLETYKYLGVDKVVAYFLKDLNWDARKVLEYYASIGFVDLYLHTTAADDTVVRVHNPPDLQSASDKQMLVFDAFERMFGYTYFGVIDYDEFLIPPKDMNLKQYMDFLYTKYKHAAGFTFLTEHYYFTWGAYGTTGDMILQKYITKSAVGPVMYEKKNMYKPANLMTGRVQTHKPRPREDMHMIWLKPEFGFIRHYRDCYDEEGCLTEWPRINDTGTAEWAQRIHENVRDIRMRLFGSKDAVYGNL